MRLRIHFFIYIFILSFSTQAQIIESFDDGNFRNPLWLGDTLLYEINSDKEVQNKGVPGLAGISSISTENKLIENISWSFRTKFNLSPSSSNFCRFYLTSDQSDLKGSLNGYYIQLGGSTGNTDSISLFRQIGNNRKRIISGRPGTVASSMNDVTVKVERDNLGMWTMYSSTADGIFVLEGAGVDSSINTSAYSGIYCKYTSSNVQSFYFDEISILPLKVDTIPPIIVSVNILSENELEIEFSEPVSSSAENVSSYTCNHGLENPKYAIRNGNKVHLIFTGTFTDKIENTLTTLNIQDFSGNKISAQGFKFTYLKPAIPTYKDIVINEIMADPSPSEDLPEKEFIELHNRSTETFNLSSFTISDPATSSLISDLILEPGTYVILCKSADTAEFKIFGKVKGLTSFPSLNNSGDLISLKDKQGILIDQVAYDLSWYQDEKKKEGGWTLEQINPLSPCRSNNWKASENNKGGTPGNKNSVYNSTPDIQAPEVSAIEIINSEFLKITFNEYMDSSSLWQGKYTLSNSYNKISVINTDEKNNFLALSCGELLSGAEHILNISEVKDCAGNLISPVKIPFNIPELEDSLDIVINEILFNPRSGGVDFVEIYNRSGKYIDLNDWGLTNGDSSSAKNIFSKQFMIHPYSYLVLTSNKNILIKQYSSSLEENIVELSSLPSFNDDMGSVLLLNKNRKIIDRFDYSESYHFSLLDSKEGVSLERISVYHASNIYDNWHSASSTEEYATPGYKNSQQNENNKQTEFSVDPHVITPDQDGYKDFTFINYKFQQGGNVANVYIYDKEGRKIKTIVRNALLSTEGFYQWDGTNEQKEQVNIGPYLVHFEIFNSSGQVKNYKETIVVAIK